MHADKDQKTQHEYRHVNLPAAARMQWARLSRSLIARPTGDFKKPD
jgi:hypothetical protein